MNFQNFNKYLDVSYFLLSWPYILIVCPKVGQYLLKVMECEHEY